MTALNLYLDNNPEEIVFQTKDSQKIAQELNQLGVRFEQWTTTSAVDESSTQDEVLAAYKEDIDRLCQEGGYQSADVISLTEDNPNKDELRQKFLDEHTHSEDEVRFFVRGNGVFYLHIENKVAVVFCQQGDLISVPANTRHWFDMGSAPNFTAIRLFTNPDGWVANYSGSDIAKGFPKYEQVVQNTHD